MTTFETHKIIISTLLYFRQPDNVPFGHLLDILFIPNMGISIIVVCCCFVQPWRNKCNRFFVYYNAYNVNIILTYFDTVTSTVSDHRQFRVTYIIRYLFFPIDKVFQYFNYSVMLSNLLAAWKLLLAFETWLNFKCQVLFRTRPG